MPAPQGGSFAASVALGIALALPQAPAAAQQTYPNKPVRLVVAFTPGSATDVTSRLVAQKISEAWGQPIVIENRAGGGSTLAAAPVAKATPDGYTLLANSAASSPSPGSPSRWVSESSLVAQLLGMQLSVSQSNVSVNTPLLG